MAICGVYNYKNVDEEHWSKEENDKRFEKRLVIIELMVQFSVMPPDFYQVFAYLYTCTHTNI